MGRTRTRAEKVADWAYAYSAIVGQQVDTPLKSEFVSPNAAAIAAAILVSNSVRPDGIFETLPELQDRIESDQGPNDNYADIPEEW